MEKYLLSWAFITEKRTDQTLKDWKNYISEIVTNPLIIKFK